MVGWFLYTAVKSSAQGAKIRQGLKRLTVRSIMVSLSFTGFPWPTASATQSIRPDDDLLSALEKMQQMKADQLTVVEGGKVVGLLRWEDLARLARWLKIGVRGFEPPTPCTPCRCATGLRHTPIWAVEDLNLRPPLCKRGALTTELTAQNKALL